MKYFVDLLDAFSANRVRFLIVGAYALAFHGRPHLTVDLDVWVEPTPENAKSVMTALRDFSVTIPGLKEGDFAEPGIILQMGVEPCRIDVITEITGVGF